MLEVASRMSFGQQIVQAPDGGSTAFRDSAHAFQLGMALVGVCLLTVFGLVGARFVAGQDVAWAFAMLALVPLARGFENLDIFREQRNFNQSPAVLCEFVPQLVITLVTWPLALWLRDFRVVLFILVGKPALGLLLTHIVAVEPYGLCWRRDYLRSMVTFGWPLVLNGLLMFASQQADQFLIAGFLSAEQLASYALAFSLASVPWAVFAQPGLSLMLPVLSRVQTQREAFRNHYRSCVELASVAAVFVTLPLMVFGEQIVTVLYGGKYAGTGPLMAMLGAATAFRFLRFAPALASMALADTRNQLNSNVVRAMSVPLAAFVAGSGGSTITIAGAALLAEVAAGVYAVSRLSKRHAVPLRESAKAALFIIAFLVLAVALRRAGAWAWGLWPTALGAIALLLLVLSAGSIAFPQTVRPLLRRALSRAERPKCQGSNNTKAGRV
jgi:O-antigen/teichoic acid export membrane protein